MGISLTVDAGAEEVVVEFGLHIVLAFKVDHGSCLSLLVDEEERGDMGILGHLGVIGTEGRSNMYDTRTILGGHIVTGNHTEGHLLHLHKAVLATFAGKHLVGIAVGIFLHKVSGIVIQLLAGFHPWHELFVGTIHKIGSLIGCDDAVGHHFVAMLIVVHGLFGTCGIEIGGQSG